MTHERLDRGARPGGELRRDHDIHCPAAGSGNTGHWPPAEIAVDQIQSHTSVLDRQTFPVLFANIPCFASRESEWNPS
jgi:hypothetical protein